MIHLDTNIVVALLNEHPAALARLTETLARGTTVALSAIVHFELRYGAAKSARRTHNDARIATLLDSPIAVVPFDDAAAAQAGQIRADLERQGAPIGPFDVLIAGHALAAGAILATNNSREFSRIAALPLQDWLTPAP